MIDISAWMKDFLQALDGAFGARVWFVGLQGSYGRGEASENSDIDVVVILDELCAADIPKYHAMLNTLPHRELICGFLSGKDELLCWEPSDLFQFYHDTVPVRGSLEALTPLLDSAAVDRAIKIGACNIYHGCVHNMLHERSEEILKGLYKSASFVVQALIYRQTGRFFRHQTALLDVASAREKEIIQIFLRLKRGGAAAFENMSETLLAWAQGTITETEGEGQRT